MVKIKNRDEVDNDSKKSTYVKENDRTGRSFSLKPDNSNYDTPPVSGLNGEKGKNKNRGL